jgi:hypothetical protein
MLWLQSGEPQPLAVAETIKITWEVPNEGNGIE